MEELYWKWAKCSGTLSLAVAAVLSFCCSELLTKERLLHLQSLKVICLMELKCFTEGFPSHLINATCCTICIEVFIEGFLFPSRGWSYAGRSSHSFPVVMRWCRKARWCSWTWSLLFAIMHSLIQIPPETVFLRLTFLLVLSDGVVVQHHYCCACTWMHTFLSHTWTYIHVYLTCVQMYMVTTVQSSASSV